jgi:hypothetical protein
LQLTQRSKLLDLLDAASTAQANARTTTTTQKHTRSWDRWLSFISSIGINPPDLFLDRFDTRAKHQLLSAFVAAIRSNSITNSNIRRSSNVKAESCSTTLGHVAQAFTSNYRPDPQLTSNGRLASLLQSQLKGYRNLDPSKQPQKAIPLTLLNFIRSTAITHIDIASANLLIGAFFFAMRSCKYSKTEGTRKIKIISIQHVSFFIDNIEINHSDPRLHLADYIRITFVSQKTDKKFQHVYHHRSGCQYLCPIITWAYTIKRVISYPSTTKTSTVNTIRLANGLISSLTCSFLINKVRLASQALGHCLLGFHLHEIGLHSLRSGAAMAMFLAGNSVSTIKLTGRWSSEAFMDYIRPQIAQFSANISQSMLIHQQFTYLPTAHSSSSVTHPGPNIHQTGPQPPMICPQPSLHQDDDGRSPIDGLVAKGSVPQRSSPSDSKEEGD